MTNEEALHDYKDYLMKLSEESLNDEYEEIAYLYHRYAEVAIKQKSFIDTLKYESKAMNYKNQMKVIEKAFLNKFGKTIKK